MCQEKGSYLTATMMLEMIDNNNDNDHINHQNHHILSELISTTATATPSNLMIKSIKSTKNSNLNLNGDNNNNNDNNNRTDCLINDLSPLTPPITSPIIITTSPSPSSITTLSTSSSLNINSTLNCDDYNDKMATINLSSINTDRKHQHQQQYHHHQKQHQQYHYQHQHQKDHNQRQQQQQEHHQQLEHQEHEQQQQQQMINNNNNNNNNNKINMNNKIMLAKKILEIIKDDDYEQFCRLLRYTKPDLNVFINGQTALHYCLLLGRDISWLKLLILNGANPNLSNQDGWHPLHLAAFRGLKDVVNYLTNCNNDNSNDINDSNYFQENLMMITTNESLDTIYQ